MSDFPKKTFLQFLNGKISIEELEKNIYYNPEIENMLTPEVCRELLEFNYKSPESEYKLRKIIIEKIIGIGEFEKHKLIKLLSGFISDVRNAPEYLNEIYDLFCGKYTGDGNLIYRYKFLKKLALNYFYRLDEGYLKTVYGDKWKEEYDRIISEEVENKHKQLKPVAELIMQALKNDEIKINDDGTYSITEELKRKLED